MYDLAIFIAGPEMHHCYDEDLAFLNYFSREVVCIGNGKKNIINLENNLLNNEIDKISNRLLPEKILVYVSAHGSEFNLKHFILTDISQFGSEATKDSIFFYTKDLFNLLAHTIKKPVDVIFFPCASRYAVKDTDCLPKGSKVVIIEGYSVPNMTRDSLLKTNVKPESFSLNFYYNNLLANLGYYIDPILIESGGEIIDPVVSSPNYLGKPISTKSISYILANFGINICNTNQLCLDKLKKIIKKMSSAKSLKEFMEYDSELTKNFFLASIWIELHCPYIPNKDKINEELIKFKSKLDIYLTDKNLPFELDLNSDLWPIKMAQNRAHLQSNSFADFEKRIPEISRLYSPRACIDSIGNSGLKVKSNFFIPDYPEYGLVLGIISNLIVLDRMAR